MGTVLHARPDGYDGTWADGLTAARVRTAATVEAAVDATDDPKLECVVVERRLDGASGLDAVARIRERRPDVPIVCCSDEADGGFAAAATRRGATEYYPREGSDQSLADRVAAYCSGETTDGEGDATSRPASANGGGRIAGRPVGTPTEGAGDDAHVPAAFDRSTVLDAVDDGLYVVNGEGVIVTANEALAEMTGYETETLVGSHIGTVIDEASQERAMAAVEELRSGEGEVTFLVSIDPASGDPYPAEDHATALTDAEGELVGIAGVLRAVADKRDQEAKLERFASIVEAVDDAVYALDDEGRFEAVNEAMVELTGYDREELIGAHTSLVKDEATVERAEEKLADLLRGEDTETTFELDIRPKERDPVTCEDHMTVRTEDGEFIGTAGVLRDITDRKERERRLREARERFADLLDVSRALLGAHDCEDVAETVAEAAAETLGFDRTLVRVYDDERDRLDPVAGSEHVTPADRPTYAPGEGGPGTAFERGETLVSPDDFAGDIGADEYGSPVENVRSLYVPLGEQGVLSIGATAAGEFSDRDRSMAEILASNAAVALERVAYEDELVQYRTVLENVQDMVYVVDESVQFSLVTDPLAEWLGYDREELVGAKPSLVLAEGETERFQSAIADLYHEDSEADTRTVETEFRTADGEIKPGTVDVSLLPTEEGYAGTVGVVRDRSDLREARQKLETQRDRFTYLFDNLPDAVVEGRLDVAEQPVVDSINEAFTEVFGYSEEEIRGESLNEYVLPPDEQESGLKLDHRTAAGETVEAEVRRKTVDGYRDFLFRGIPYDTSGEMTHGFGIYTDITEQKERERRLEVLNRVLRHNLRNDLNVVLGYAEMLATRVEDDELVGWAEALHEKASEIATLGDRVRTLDKQIDRGSLRDDTVDLEAVVEEVVANVRVDHPALEVDTDLAGVRVVGDSRLGLAVSELLDNCVTHAGEDARVEITIERDDDRALLTIADDGPGIPVQEREVVTESVDITQLTHGSGLGLWIVKWICESCGGRLSFAESPLGGSAVVLSLTPADRAGDPAA